MKIGCIEATQEHPKVTILQKSWNRENHVHCANYNIGKNMLNSFSDNNEDQELQQPPSHTRRPLLLRQKNFIKTNKVRANWTWTTETEPIENPSAYLLRDFTLDEDMLCCLPLRTIATVFCICSLLPATHAKQIFLRRDSLRIYIGVVNCIWKTCRQVRTLVCFVKLGGQCKY